MGLFDGIGMPGGPAINTPVLPGYHRGGRGIVRVLLNDSAINDGSVPFPYAGKALLFPKRENVPGMTLRIWVGDPASSTPLKLPAGAVFSKPFNEGELRIGLSSVDNVVSGVSGTAFSPVLYVFDDIQDAWWFESRDTAQHGPPPSYFLRAGGSTVTGTLMPLYTGGAFATRVPEESGSPLWSSPPLSATGWNIDGVASINLYVLDKSTASASAAGIILRPWWYIGGHSTSNTASSATATTIFEATGAATGWVPDPTTYTVADFERAFAIQPNVRSGFFPNWLAALNYQFQARQTVLDYGGTVITPAASAGNAGASYKTLSAGMRMAIQATGTPAAGCDCYLVAQMELLP